jgi:hypothetical protein
VLGLVFEIDQGKPPVCLFLISENQAGISLLQERKSWYKDEDPQRDDGSQFKLHTIRHKKADNGLLKDAKLKIRRVEQERVKIPQLLLHWRSLGGEGSVMKLLLSK